MKIARLDMLARLMANENISVTYLPEAKTASFNVQTRVLTVPMWQNITRNIHILFISHEVSHAKHTPFELFDLIKAKYGEKRYDHNLLNIVEDVRIENLIVLDYPKLTPFYQDGYTDLLGKGFWKLPENLEELETPLEIRINAQAKLRRLVDIKFTDEEKKIYEFLQSMRTVDDCVEGYGLLLKHLEENDADYVKRREQMEKLKEAIANGLSNLDEFLKDGAGEGSGESEAEGKGNGKGKSNVRGRGDSGGDASDAIGDVVGAAIRQIAQDNKDADPRNGGGMSQYYTGHVSYATPKLTPKGIARVDEDKRVVSALVMEFQRRKAAMVAIKTREHHTGDIAQNLLHKAKYSDDIFKTSRNEPIGKNHGISFLIDISGSMENIINSVMRRVVMVTSFCEKQNIPFQVFGFTSKGFGNNATVSLFFDSKMTKKVREDHINSLLARGKFPLEMGGTPLSASMLFYAGLVKKFRVENNLDLVTSILLTDGGEGSSPKQTNYYDNGLFVETSFPVTLCEMVNKHLRDVGINTIHHHIGDATSYPFTAGAKWSARQKGETMRFSAKDEIFDLRIHENEGKNLGDTKVYARMMADIMNHRN